MSDPNHGDYTPEWTTVSGFSDEDRLSPTASYSRSGDLVTVVCVLGSPGFALGKNRATLTVPDHLPVARYGWFVSGVFGSDHYVNSGLQNVGLVARNDTKSVMLCSNGPAGLASCWCHFVYRTDAG